MCRSGAFLVFIGLLGLLQGCAVAPPPVPVVWTHPFVQDDYIPFVGEGTGTIEGQAFLTTRGGDVKLGAGKKVFLLPDTPHSREWIEKCVVGKVPRDVNNSKVFMLSQSQVADAEGRFTFSKLPAAPYLFFTVITWETVGSSVSLEQTGGWAFGGATAVPGETVKVVVK